MPWPLPLLLADLEDRLVATPAKAAALLLLLNARSTALTLLASLMVAPCCAVALAALRSRLRTLWPRVIVIRPGELNQALKDLIQS